MATSFYRSALESIVAKVLYLLTRLAIPPMVLSQVGLVEYGLWSISFVLVGYLGLSVSGLATVYVREIAQAYERDDAEHASGMLSTGVALALLLGSAFCATLSLALPYLLDRFNVSAELRATASLLIITTTLVFLADLTIGAWGYVLHGLHRVHEQQRIWVASFLLEWACIAALLYLHFGIQALLISFVVRYGFSICCAWWRVKQIWPALQLSPRLIARRHFAAFIQLGLKTQFSDACAMVLHSADRLLAALSFGSTSSAILDLGSKLPATATSIASGISAVILPRSACMKPEELRVFYPKALRLTTFSLLPIMPLMVACAPAINLAWLGARPEAGLILGALLWLTPAWHCHILTGSASSSLRGQGQIKLEFTYHLLRAIALGTAFFFAHNLSQFIALFAFGAVLASLGYLLLASQALGLAPLQLSSTCLQPIALCYVAAYGFQWLWPWQAHERASAVLELIQAGSIFSASLLVLCWLAILNSKEKATVARICIRPFQREVNHA